MTEEIKGIVQEMIVKGSVLEDVRLKGIVITEHARIHMKWKSRDG